MNSQLLMRMLGMGQQRQPQAQQQPGSRLMQSMLRGKGQQGTAKYKGLEALPPYAEQKHAGSFKANQKSDPYGAFQDDAFQNDAYQVGELLF